MFTNHRLCKLLCAILRMGAWMGTPMRPEEIDSLMRTTGQIPVQCTGPENCDGPEDIMPHGGAVNARRPMTLEDALL